MDATAKLVAVRLQPATDAAIRALAAKHDKGFGSLVDFFCERGAAEMRSNPKLALRVAGSRRGRNGHTPAE